MDAARRAWTTLAGLALAVLGFLAAARLAALALADRGLPLWDEAAHGWAGVQLADAARRLDLPSFLGAINRQVTWPPVHSLLVLPFHLALGDGYSVPAAASAWLYGAAAAATFMAGLAVHPKRGAWVGAAAAALVLQAPVYRLFGTLGMLEISGALMLAVSVAFYAWSLRAGAPRGALVWAGAAAAALFLTKYNYGLLWIATVALNETLLHPGALRRGPEAAWRWLRARPFAMFAAAYLVALAVVVLAGGFAFDLLGWRVSLRSPGNPAYLLLVLVVLRLVVWRLTRPGEATAWWETLEPRARALLASLVAPIVVWLLVPYPNRVKELLNFVVNRRSDTPLLSADGLLFYPRAFLADYAPHAVVGIVILVLALVPWVRSHPRGPANMMRLGAWLGIVTTLLHPYRDSRFLFTTALLIWLAAAATVAQLGARLLDRVPAAAARVAWGAALIALLVAAALVPAPDDALRSRRSAWRSPAELSGVLDAVIGESGHAGPRPILLGYCNPISPALLAWHAHLAGRDPRRYALPERLPRLPADDPAAIADRARSLSTAARPVLVVMPTPGSPELSPDLESELRVDRAVADHLIRTPGIERVFSAPVAGWTIDVLRSR
jgi:hypothetical protein